MVATAPGRTLRFEDNLATVDRPSTLEPTSTVLPSSSNVFATSRPKRPLTRRRGWSVPEAEAFSAVSRSQSFRWQVAGAQCWRIELG